MQHPLLPPLSPPPALVDEPLPRHASPPLSPHRATLPQQLSLSPLPPPTASADPANRLDPGVFLTPRSLREPKPILLGLQQGTVLLPPRTYLTPSSLSPGPQPRAASPSLAVPSPSLLTPSSLRSRLLPTISTHQPLSEHPRSLAIFPERMSTPSRGSTYMKFLKLNVPTCGEISVLTGLPNPQYFRNDLAPLPYFTTYPLSSTSWDPTTNLLRMYFDQPSAFNFLLTPSSPYFSFHFSDLPDGTILVPDPPINDQTQIIFHYVLSAVILFQLPACDHSWTTGDPLLCFYDRRGMLGRRQLMSLKDGRLMQAIILQSLRRELIGRDISIVSFHTRPHLRRPTDYYRAMRRLITRRRYPGYNPASGTADRQQIRDSIAAFNAEHNPSRPLTFDHDKDCYLLQIFIETLYRKSSDFTDPGFLLLRYLPMQLPGHQLQDHSFQACVTWNLSPTYQRTNSPPRLYVPTSVSTTNVITCNLVPPCSETVPQHVPLQSLPATSSTVVSPPAWSAFSRALTVANQKERTSRLVSRHPPPHLSLPRRYHTHHKESAFRLCPLQPFRRGLTIVKRIVLPQRPPCRLRPPVSAPRKYTKTLARRSSARTALADLPNSVNPSLRVNHLYPSWFCTPISSLLSVITSHVITTPVNYHVLLDIA